MKRAWIFPVCVLGLVLSLACGTSSGGVDCPDGLEPHRASQRFHGYTFDTNPGTACMDATDFCADFSGQVNAINHDESSWQRCGGGMWGIPNHKHGLCTADGWVTLWWDGNPSWVCVSYHEETSCCE